MTRDPVDFFTVEDKHVAIHKRLENWAQWSYSGGGGGASPMFRLYRSDEHREGLTVPIPVDALDAARMQKAVVALPEKHRGAITWHYIRPSDPRRMARALAVTLGELARLVRDGRQMLVNRGA